MIRLAPFVAIALVGSGCASGRGKMAAGLVTTAIGGAIAVDGARGHSCNSDIDFICDPYAEGISRAELTLGLVLVGTGLLIALVGASTPDEPSYAPPLPQPQPIVSLPSGPPGFAFEPAPLPADLAIRTQMQNQLAIQISVAARRGDCASAVATGHRLVEIDPTLHEKLVERDTAYADCVRRARQLN